MANRSARRKKEAHVIGKIAPEHVETFKDVVKKEEVVLVALPKTLWQKVKDSFGF